MALTDRINHSRRFGFICLFFISFATITAFFISSHYRNFDPQMDLSKSDAMTGAGLDHFASLVVHQSWRDESLPPELSKWSNTWRKCFPHADYILWTDEKNRRFIKDYYPWFLLKYDSLRHDRQRANVARYFQLFHYGGIHTDIDTECVQPFRSLLLPYRVVLSAMEGVPEGVTLPEGFVQNSFIYSRRRDPFWLEVIHQLPPMGNITSSLEEMTGSQELMKSVLAYRKRFGEDGRTFKIYTPKYFNPISWITKTPRECFESQMDKRKLKACRSTIIKSSFVIQYHTHHQHGRWDKAT